MTIPSGGYFNWFSGTLSGTGTLTVASGGSATLSGGGGLRRAFVNQGAVSWTGGDISVASGGSFTNQSGGTFTALANGPSFFPNFTNSNGATFTQTANKSSYMYGVFNNAGTVNVDASATLSMYGTVTQYASATSTLTGGTWNVSDGTLVFPTGNDITTN
jgi:hypothetical protein